MREKSQPLAGKIYRVRIFSPESATGWLSPQAIASGAATAAAKPAKPKKRSVEKAAPGEPTRSAAR
jgi:hypothetical protein